MKGDYVNENGKAWKIRKAYGGIFVICRIGSRFIIRLRQGKNGRTE